MGQITETLSQSGSLSVILGEKCFARKPVLITKAKLTCIRLRAANVRVEAS